MGKQRIWRGLLAAVAVVALAGCVGVPTSGIVTYHTPGQTRVESEVGVAPLPPSDGANPSLIVEGFLHAMSVYQPGYAVARQYLAPSVREKWDPGAGVRVYTSDEYPVTQVVDDDVLLSARLVGTLDAGGQYQAASGKVLQDFKLVSEDGQWRISNPPEGLLISSSLFATDYVGVDLHYLSADKTVMVPDVRWIPGGDDQLLRTLQRQVSGPGDWVKPLVSFVEGVEVTGVTTVGGIATVGLGGTAGTLGTDDRRAVLAGIVFTATQFTEVSQVEARVDSASWTLPGHPGTAFATSDFADWAPGAGNASLFVIKDGQVQEADSSSQLKPVADGLREPQPDKTGKTDTPGLSGAFAVSGTRKQAAVVMTAKGGDTIQTASLAGGDEPVVVRQGKSFVRPAYSRTGELWTAQRAGLSTLEVIDARGEPLKVSVPKTPAGTLVALRLSPDGARVAVALSGPGGPELGLLRVQRVEGELRLDGWHPIAFSDAQPLIDVAWSKPAELLVLVGDPGQGTTSVLRTSQDGARSAYIGPSADTDLAELAAAPGSSAVARSALGTVYRFDADFTWPQWLLDIRGVAFAE